MNRITITMIGAGSTIFMKNILGDVLLSPEIGPVHIVLQDINSERLHESAIILEKLIAFAGNISNLSEGAACDATYETQTNQQRAIASADFVIVCFQIGGYKPSTVIDFEIPKKYGLRQTIADSLGVGGIMRALRTVPHLLSICDDIQQYAPHAWLLNYVNPMCMNTWTMYELAPKVQQVGLCHSVQNTLAVLAAELDVPADEIRFTSAGINHMSFFLTLEQRLSTGAYKNLYPDLLAQYRDNTSPSIREMERCANIVRFEMLKHFGYFVTESSEHFSEYVPWFIKRNRDDLIQDFRIPIDEYIARCQEQIQQWDNQIDTLKNMKTIEIQKSHEYASKIIRAILTDTPATIYGNVRNDHLITNLPHHCCVEVPCMVDSNGISPVHIGALPPHLASLMRTNVNVQYLVVEAIKNQDKKHVYHAAMLDPHTASELDLNQITALIDDLVIAHGDMLPEWMRL